MNGFIVVNKEAGMTSRDVVNKLNRLLGTKKIGHTGTLDPMATGVLVMCTGKYTKLVLDITGYDKTYVAGVKLGIKTDTLDTTGTVLETKDYNFTKQMLEEVLNSFVGSYDQEVPIYSSVKINGKKLYEYARANESIELPKREVTINKIKLISFENDSFEFEVNVSKGTYIRSLINDICFKLNTVGSMSSLVRTEQGNFTLDNSYFLKDIESNNYKMLSIDDVIDYEVFDLSDDEYFKVKNGAKLNVSINDGRYIMKYQNDTIAIYEFLDNVGKIHVML